jgi:V/A-type H+-transporting ATPase subunit I
MGVIRYFKRLKKSKSETHKAEQDRRDEDSGGRRGRRAADRQDSGSSATSRPDLLILMVSLEQEHKQLEARRLELARAHDRVTPWGEFNPKDILELRSKGVELYLYSMFPEEFDNIPKDIQYIKLDQDKTTVRFATVGKKIPGLHHFRLPEKPLSEFKKDLDKVTENLETHLGIMKSFATRWPILEREMAAVDNKIYFEEALANYESIKGELPYYNISYLKGYIPTEDVPKVKAAAAENGWALSIAEPTRDDPVPTKLKNPKAVKLLDPLVNFLDLVPGYHEVDVSGWFLLFFCIFFSMIFGDAGYGILLLLMSLFGVIKTAKKGVPDVLKLACLLSVSNVVWGVICCAWFGLPVERLPQFFRDISLSYFSPAKTEQVIIDQNLKIFCFSLALIHLTIAHLHVLVKSIKKKSLKLLSDLGSIGMLWGMYNVVLFLAVSNSYRTFEIWPFTIHLIAAGVILNFLFLYYEGSFKKSILNGAQNLFSIVLGVSGVFSDIMSYIRLWAVGMAGAAIATMVTTMAGPMLGSFLIFFGIVLLVFGHGFNMVLTVLSVLVHGVRLNILEFSSRADLTWAGVRYKPFEETVIKIKE